MIYTNSLFDTFLLDRRDPIHANGIELEVPGFGSDDLEITIEGRYLRVLGEKGDRRVMKSYYVPHDVKDFTATLEHGLLNVEFIRSEPRSIAIQPKTSTKPAQKLE